MIAALLRVFLTVVTVFFAVVAITAAIMMPRGGTYGLPPRDQFVRGPLAWHVRYVPPRSAAADGGIIAGDVVALRSPYVEYRRGNALVGEHIDVRITRHGEAHDATLIAKPLTPNKNALLARLDALNPWLRLIAQLAMYGLALIIIAKKWENISARSLAIFLMSFGYSLSIDAPFRMLSGPLLIAGHFALNLSIVIGLSAVMRFATSFPDHERPELDPDGIRGLIRRSVPFFAIGMALDTTAEIGPQYAFGYYEPITDALWWSFWGYALVATIAALFIAARCAVGTARQRYLYITATFLIGFAGPIVSLIGVVLGLNYEAWARLRLTSIVIPFGFGYAMLRHHVLDVNFVLNRAVVYTFISSLILPIMGLSEALSKEALRGGSDARALGSVIALVAFFIMQNFKSKATLFVDSVFFKKRIKMEKNIRLSVDEMAYVDDPQLLAERAVLTLERELHARAVAVYVREGDVFYARATSFADAPMAIAASDDAVIRMQARHEPLDTKAIATAAPGILVLPATKRGPLRAFLACDYRNSDEVYDKDERLLLQEFAEGLGFALDHERLRGLERGRAILDQTPIAARV